MTPATTFWNEQYGIGRPLETDTRLRRLLNRCVVAAMMNTFPKTAIRFFSISKGELARLILWSARGLLSQRSAMYRYDDAHGRGDLLNRLLMESPAVKARGIAGASRTHAAAPVGSAARTEAGPGSGGGRRRRRPRGGGPCRLARSQLVLLRIGPGSAQSPKTKMLHRRGLAERGFTIVGSVAENGDVEAALDCRGRRFGVRFDGVGVAICQGVAEYLDIGSNSNLAFSRLLRALHACTLDEGSPIISHTDYHDRVPFLERGLGWHMRLSLTAGNWRPRWRRPAGTS